MTQGRGEGEGGGPPRSDTSILKVEILGKEYRLRSKGGQEHVQRVADYLEGRIREVMEKARPTSHQAAVVLAALNITNELLQLKETQQHLLQEIEANTERLLFKLEQEDC